MSVTGFISSSASGINAVNFDGTNDYLSQASISGASDSKLWTFSGWVKMGAGTDGFGLPIFYAYQSNQSLSAYIYRLNNNSVRFLAMSDPITTILNVSTPANSLVVADGWVNILAAFDMSNSGKRFVYFNDVLETLTVTTYTNDFIDFTMSTPGYIVGANSSLGVQFNGDMADIWLAPGVYIDISVEANRRKFIDASGKPVDLGSDGSTPTGVSPLVFLSGDTSAWHTNKGSGNGFTETGALTTASTSPSD